MQDAGEPDVSEFSPLLTRCLEFDDSHTLGAYRRQEGYEALRRALECTPDQVAETVKQAKLRGRGGAGFPTGVKWSFMPKEVKTPHCLVCNADESEPGTFKDRLIIERNPHLLLEGCLIAAYAIRAEVVYLYLRGEFPDGWRIVRKAVAEAEKAGFIGANILGSPFTCRVIPMRGAGAYICGEETALLDSIEGKRGYPRMKPPFPALFGVHGHPTTVNNVETLSCVPLILLRGAEWFRSIGKEGCPGPKLYCVSGMVKRPGVYELPMGIPLRRLIEDHAGGLREGRRLNAVIPGGVSAPPLLPTEIDIDMDFDSLAKAGTMLGSAGVIVIDDSVCMVRVLENILRFFAHESCGQCTPCREGVPWLSRIISRIEAGRGDPADLGIMEEICANMRGHTICLLADAAAMPTQRILQKWRPLLEEHIKQGKCSHTWN
jgi:NADH-quinone oxidoreductase subunit F